MLDCVETPRICGIPLEANGAYLNDPRERNLAVHCRQKSPGKLMTLSQSLLAQMRTPGTPLVESDAPDIWGSFSKTSPI